MTYAMTLDNSWELMNEDEMYEINGGFLGWKWETFRDNIIGWMESSAMVRQAMIAAGITTTYLLAAASFGFTAAVATFGTPVITAATIATGPVGLLIGGLGVVAAVYALGTIKIY
ncbi:MAG: hypothetical protein RBT45_05755 [Acholeplasmataceae bacterium]|nr:hypothetical protein [Acholeplasmataceae bacterium]